MSLLYTVSYVTPGVVFILADNYSRLNVLRIENADSFSIRGMSNGRHPRGKKITRLSLSKLENMCRMASIWFYFMKKRITYGHLIDIETEIFFLKLRQTSHIVDDLIFFLITSNNLSPSSSLTSRKRLKSGCSRVSSKLVLFPASFGVPLGHRL